jgi:hypothetical protein
MTEYQNRATAEKNCAKRSLFAALSGRCSQFELRTNDTGRFVGGPCGELAKQLSGWRIIGQWSAGYRQPKGFQP